MPAPHTANSIAFMGLVVLPVLFALLVLVILPIWVFIKVRTFSSSDEVLEARLAALEQEIRQLRQAAQLRGSSSPLPPTPP